MDMSTGGGANMGHRGGGFLPPGVGHGSAELGARHSRSPSVGTPRNDRERDRPRPRSPSASVRSASMGPQEAADWRQAIENVGNRVEALERYSRLHAQSISTTDKEVKSMMTDCRRGEDDKAKYKVYVENRFTNMEQVIAKQFDEVRTLISQEPDQKLKDMEEKIGIMGAQLSELLRVFNHRGGPTIYEMGTPVPEARDAARGSNEQAPVQAGPAPTEGMFARNYAQNFTGNDAPVVGVVVNEQSRAQTPWSATAHMSNPLEQLPQGQSPPKASHG